MTPKVVFLDMDGVLANFDEKIAPNSGWDPPEMFVPGFFRNLNPMPGSKSAVARLLENPALDIYIGSKPSTKATNSATEKLDWVAEHFPPLLKRVVLVCDKALLRGDVLVDDDLGRWGGKFQGLFIHFDRHHPEQAWRDAVVNLSTL